MLAVPRDRRALGRSKHEDKLESKRDREMDMRKYSGHRYIKPDHVRYDQLQEQIVDVRLGNYDKPDLIFESGDLLSLNATNNQTLICAYGANSDDWCGKVIELFLGELKFQGKTIEAVLVRPISPPLEPAEQTKPNAPKEELSETEETSRAGDVDDNIPF
jgi:hypothetical protein